MVPKPKLLNYLQVMGWWIECQAFWNKGGTKLEYVVCTFLLQLILRHFGVKVRWLVAYSLQSETLAMKLFL